MPPTYQYIYVMQNLVKTWPGGKTVLQDVTLSFYPGAKIGVLGPNGAGKSTLLKIMAGVDKEFQGEAWAAQGTRIGYLAQEPQLDPKLNVHENILQGLGPIKALVDRYNEVSAKFAEEMTDGEMNALIEEQGKLQEQIDAADAWDLDRTVAIAMDALRCPAGDKDVTKLSGGERRRVALARLLLERPDMMLLDEPTNHLDAESVEWLQRFLLDYTGTVVMITHDRYFLDNVTGWILELDRGRSIPYEGNYSAYLEQKRKRMLLEQKQEEERGKTLARELDWIRATPEARRKKSKARIAAYQQMVSENENETVGHAQIVIPTPPRLGNLVIEAQNIAKAFGDKVLIKDLSFKLPAGGIVGIIGENGAGKTTLFRMITGTEQPDAGTFRVSDTVKLGYVDQSRDSLDANKNIWEEVSGGVDILKLGNITMQSRAYVAAFNFRGTDQQKKVGQLSGGERNRVHLAKMLKSGANVLLLDEPTNDLDTETLSALEEALETFPGCAVVISHDRWFLDRLATHILAFEGDGEVVWFEGNYQDYEQDLRRRMGLGADEPMRFKHRKLA
jgi:energy-dependent translational throttle protein EttA